MAEDELANETNWMIQKRNSKKRKAASSPEISPQKVEDTSKKLKIISNQHYDLQLWYQMLKSTINFIILSKK